jgi:hypothetical protein
MEEGTAVWLWGITFELTGPLRRDGLARVGKMYRVPQAGPRRPAVVGPVVQRGVRPQRILKVDDRISIALKHRRGCCGLGLHCGTGVGDLVHQSVAIATSLTRALDPVLMVTADLVVPKCLASRDISSALAFPSMGCAFRLAR